MNVSRETLDMFAIYEKLLIKWQSRINLVSPTTLNDVKNRHFEDSLKIMPLIQGASVIDLGSGAGFPGMIVAMANPSLCVTLIEADERKCAFLKAVSRETVTTVNVINKRVEDIPFLDASVITARAVAPLIDLLTMVNLKINAATTEMIFLKGKSWQEEIIEAQKKYEFSYRCHDNDTIKGSVILIIKDVSVHTA